MPPAIETAELDWQDGQPICSRFGDVYFNRDNGLEETRYVFLHHNRLAERLGRVENGQHFVVAETGFGTGLNFLATWQLWRKVNSSPFACLHFVSVERFPLARSDLEQALSLWPDLAPLVRELVENYPPAMAGTHRLTLDQGRVRLTLYLGDILDALNSLEFTADAWFLDGFAPACNPRMWDTRVITGIQKHSQPGTTLATFTAAGQVRRLLSAAGFDMAKVAGFGRKRDMLAGTIPGPATPASPSLQAGRIAIVGAGIAGAALANNLARRGFGVTLIDRGREVASEASGNSQGALYVKLGVDYGPQTELAASCLLFAQRFYSSFGGTGWHQTGLLQLAHNDTEEHRQRRFAARNAYPVEMLRPVSADEATRLAGIPVPYPGLWFPASGWLEPAEICRQLCDHPNIRLVPDTTVTGLRPESGCWQLVTRDNQSLRFDRVILCAGAGSPQLVPGDGQYRLRRIRGQVTLLPDPHLDAPDVVICGPGYVNPAHRGHAMIGATFDLHNSSAAVTQAGNLENLLMANKLLPTFIKSGEVSGQLQDARGRVAFRCTTHDYQPVAGPMKTREARVLEGLYLFTGLGSKGLTYSTLLAEYLGDLLSDQPRSLPSHLAKRVEIGRCHRRRVTES